MRERARARARESEREQVRAREREIEASAMAAIRKLAVRGRKEISSCWPQFPTSLVSYSFNSQPNI